MTPIPPCAVLSARQKKLHAPPRPSGSKQLVVPKPLLLQKPPHAAKNARLQKPTPPPNARPPASQNRRCDAKPPRLSKLPTRFQTIFPTTARTTSPFSTSRPLRRSQPAQLNHAPPHSQNRPMQLLHLPSYIQAVTTTTAPLRPISRSSAAPPPGITAPRAAPRVIILTMLLEYVRFIVAPTPMRQNIPPAVPRGTPSRRNIAPSQRPRGNQIRRPNTTFPHRVHLPTSMKARLRLWVNAAPIPSFNQLNLLVLPKASQFPPTRRPPASGHQSLLNARKIAFNLSNSSATRPTVISPGLSPPAQTHRA
jgi:hypothetical protein